jgi:mRNA interferase MazF
MVEAEQVQTIDKDRLIRWIGHLDARDIAGIEEAVRNHFGFDIPDCIEAP